MKIKNLLNVVQTIPRKYSQDTTNQFVSSNKETYHAMLNRYKIYTYPIANKKVQETGNSVNIQIKKPSNKTTMKIMKCIVK